MLKIVDKYIIKQLIKTFLSSFIILTALMLLVNIIQMSHVIFAQGVTLHIIFKILYQQTTFVSMFTIPMALTVAVNFVYTDFAKNNEILAFQTSGISKSNLYKPALVFTIFIFFIAFLNTSSIAYKQRGEFHLTLLQLAKHKIYSEISEKSFFHFSKNSVIYAETISPDTLKLKSIFLQTPRETITAQEGHFGDSPQGTTFSMKNGNMYKETNIGIETATFKKFNTFISTQRIVQKEEEIRENPKYMSMWQLMRIKDDFAKMQINKMFVLAFSVFVLSLIAFGLGVISKAGKSFGFALCLLIFVLFYIFQIFGEGIAKSMHTPFYMWLPNIILAIFGIILFLSVVRR
jgi:lipopolysaccharide export system permease protein